MKKNSVLVVLVVTLALSMIRGPSGHSAAQNNFVWPYWDYCEKGAFSVEVDFVPYTDLTGCTEIWYLSDGDLLATTEDMFCVRNSNLLEPFGVDPINDLGLDAVDILDFNNRIIAFSTELDAPNGAFSEGDLLIVSDPGSDPPIRVVIPNAALFLQFQFEPRPGENLGLDGLHFVGDDPGTFYEFALAASETAPQDWLNGALQELLHGRDMDLWFSVEGTWVAGYTVLPTDQIILDGDLLSVMDGIKVTQSDLLQTTPDIRTVQQGSIDFGLDALAGSRDRNSPPGGLLFSTEISYSPTFTEGDVLEAGGNVVISSHSLLSLYEIGGVGLDALWLP